jgi:hypothetical protein
MRWEIGLLVFAAACATRHPYPEVWPTDLGSQHHALVAEESAGADGERPEAERETKNEAILMTGYTTERGEGGFTLGLTYKGADLQAPDQGLVGHRRFRRGGVRRTHRVRVRGRTGV